MAMLAMVAIPYGHRDVVKKLDRESYERLRAEIPNLGLYEWKEDKDVPPDWYGPGGEMLIDLETDGKALAMVGINFEVKRFKGAYFCGDVGTYQTKVAGPQVSATTVIQVAIPDLALLSINEVKLLDDCCTDALQDMLSEGWRIIAICPPNSQRRPDYIVGRHVP